MMPGGWIIAGAVLVGLLLIVGGGRLRRRFGLGAGRTIALDNVLLTSHRLGLTGRPDRLIKGGGTIIPEEWKSSRAVWPKHWAQMGVYFLLIEDQLEVRPPHGFIVCGNGTRHRIENTAELRAWVLELAGQIRAARAAVIVSEVPRPPVVSAGLCVRHFRYNPLYFGIRTAPVETSSTFRADARISTKRAGRRLPRSDFHGVRRGNHR